jgi:hypothetical protein
MPLSHLEKILWRSIWEGRNCSELSSVKPLRQSPKLEKFVTFLQLRRGKFHIVGWFENPRVDGSIPSQATKTNPSSSNVARVFYFLRASFFTTPTLLPLCSHAGRLCLMSKSPTQPRHIRRLLTSLPTTQPQTIHLRDGELVLYRRSRSLL